MIPSIDHWIGQRQAIRRFKVGLEASWNDGSRLPHMLLVGPPGVGKTMLAQLSAREIGEQLHERVAQVLNFPGALNGILMQAKSKEVLFLDEAHMLNDANQVLLYRAMENQQLSIRTHGEKTMTLALEDFTIILGTTHEFLLAPPLRDRCAITLHLTTYNTDDLARITIQHAQLSGIEIQPKIGLEIAKRSRGTPRLALRLLASCHRYARSIGESKITMDHFEATVALEELDKIGLGPDEQRFINYLMKQLGKPARLFSIEAAIDVHHRTIQTVIEPFLIRMGLIERTSQGRVITEKGILHVEGSEETVAAEETAA